jgi:hypothetical protein
MKPLLTTTAVIEAGAGVGLMTLPSMVARLLLGSSLETPAASIVGRVAGVALVALGVACWLARHDGESHAGRGLAGAMVLYNAGVLVVLVYGGISLGLSGIGLWPAVMVHAAMAVWCLVGLGTSRS